MKRYRLSCPEEISPGCPSKQKKWRKRLNNRALRRLFKKYGEEAPTRVTRGWSD